MNWFNPDATIGEFTSFDLLSTAVLLVDVRGRVVFANQAAEWIDIIEKAYASDEPFDFDGNYYKLKGVVSRPASLQAPRPVTMNAAFASCHATTLRESPRSRWIVRRSGWR